MNNLNSFDAGKYSQVSFESPTKFVFSSAMSIDLYSMMLGVVFLPSLAFISNLSVFALNAPLSFPLPS